jgi:hypothetical protein
VVGLEFYEVVPRCRKTIVFCILVAASTLEAATATAEPKGRELRRFDAPEATQAVAVDGEHFYAIGNRVIGKYDKRSGRLVKRWTASDALPIAHLNSGVVLDGKLYCAHSNFPHYPESSSVEVWGAATLHHVASHSFGIYEGSLTWVDWHEDAWWAVFAHYTEKVNDNSHARDARWTSLVKFDRDWRRTAGWTFPPEVIARFEPHSCSGGSWGDDGFLYCTGHDRGELYQLAIPRAGAALGHTATIAVPITGQGFAFDRTDLGVAYGIERPHEHVVVVRLPQLPAKKRPQVRATTAAAAE